MGGRLTSPRFVGRAAELAGLRDLLDEAIAGRPQVVLVVGDAGIGKSRLVAEAVGVRQGRRGGTHLAGSRVRLLVGQCLALPDGGLPYAPLTEALRHLARQTDPEVLDDLLGPARTELARLLPELSGGSPSPAPGPVGRADQARLFELVLGLLGRLSVGAPTILVVEDLHWVDDATRALLTFLARNLSSERVLLVATCRSDAADAPPDLPTWLAELARSPVVTRLDLGPLGSGEVRDQLAGILGDAPPADLAISIAARSGGNALFAEELLAAVADGEDERLPATLADILLGRVRGLTGPARDVTAMLAIAGRAVDERLVGAATSLSEADLVAGLRSAVAQHVVVSEPVAGTVALRHVLLAEAIRADLLAAERRRLHERFAEALTAHPGLAAAGPAGAAGELAAHWAAADRAPEAFATALAAARAARVVHAHSEAWRQYGRAIDRWDALPPGERTGAPDLVPLLLEAEEVADLAGRAAEAEALVHRCLLLVDPEEDPQTAGFLHGRLGYQHWLAGRSHEELEEYRTAAALVPQEPPSLARARVLRGLGGALMGLGRFGESIEACEAAIAAARAARVPLEEGRARGMLGMDLVGLGDVDAGIAQLEQARAIAREHDPLDGLVVVLSNLALHLLLVDRAEEALAAAGEGVEVARRVGLDRRFGRGLRALAADALLRLGRWPEADAAIAEGLALGPEGHGSLHLRIVEIRLATAEGRFDAARAAMAAAAPLAEGDVDYDLVAYLRTAEAELACWDDRLADAHDAVTAGLAALAASDDVFLTAPLLALGMRVEAERAEAARTWRDDAAVEAATAEGAVLDEAAASLRSRLTGTGRRPTPGTAAALDLAAAERGRLDGRPDPAAWAGVAARWEAVGQPSAALYARLREAEARLASADGDGDAAEALRRAADGAARLGAAPLSDLAVAVARRADVALGPQPGSAGSPGEQFEPGSEGSPRAHVAPGVGGARPARSDRVRRTFLFTDIVRSTALIEAIGDDAWSDLRAWHDATLRSLFAENGGEEIDHAGDGFFVAFESARAAVACAVAVQRALAGHRRASGFAPAVRIGLHQGAAIRSAAGYTGREVHLAARLLTRAEGGEIVATGSTLRAAGRRPAAAVSVELAGISGPVEIARVSWR